MVIKLVNSDWKIELKSPNDPALYVDGSARCGACWPAAKMIAISDELSEGSAREVIRHELCHAVFAKTQITRSDQFSEEEICDMVGKWGGYIEDLQKKAFSCLCEKGKKEERT